MTGTPDPANLYTAPGMCVLGAVMGGGAVTSKQVAASALKQVQGVRCVDGLLVRKLVQQHREVSTELSTDSSKTHLGESGR